MPRYVYVVMQGCYSDRGIVGVYATPEAAMEHHPVPARAITQRRGTYEREGGWRPSVYAEDGQQWDNGLDWEDAKEIIRFEVDATTEAARAGCRDATHAEIVVLTSTVVDKPTIQAHILRRRAVRPRP